MLVPKCPCRHLKQAVKCQCIHSSPVTYREENSFGFWVSNSVAVSGDNLLLLSICRAFKAGAVSWAARSPGDSLPLLGQRRARGVGARGPSPVVTCGCPSTGWWGKSWQKRWCKMVMCTKFFWNIGETGVTPPPFRRDFLQVSVLTGWLLLLETRVCSGPS